jgi:phage shock protein A
MFKALKRWWKYLGAKVGGSLDERADPKVQIQQAITEAQDQHRRLREQAANVIANQKQLEMQLSRTMGELEKANGNARQALMMQSQATQTGDDNKAAELGSAAESIASRLIELERAVEEQKTMVLQATQAAAQAKTAVQQNSLALQKKLGERQKLLSQLDQAKMQEQLNTAMATLSESVGQDVPTFDEVRDKIEARYAKAKGMAELQGQTVENRMLEIEQATANAEAKGRLDAMRVELGLPSGGNGSPAAVEPPASPPA